MGNRTARIASRCREECGALANNGDGVDPASCSAGNPDSKQERKCGRTLKRFACVGSIGDCCSTDGEPRGYNRSEGGGTCVGSECRWSGRWSGEAGRRSTADREAPCWLHSAARAGICWYTAVHDTKRRNYETMRGASRSPSREYRAQLVATC